MLSSLKGMIISLRAMDTPPEGNVNLSTQRDDLLREHVISPVCVCTSVFVDMDIHKGKGYGNIYIFWHRARPGFVIHVKDRARQPRLT